MKKKLHLSKHQRGHAWTEIILGSLLLTMLLTNSIRGYHLLQQSKTVQLHYYLNQIRSAWYDFQDKYHAMPGDYAFAQSNIDSSLHNGNGNGLLDSDQERGQVWAHLAAAGLLKNRVAIKDFNITQLCQYARCPYNGFGQGFLISFTAANDNTLLTVKGVSLTTLALLDQQIDDGLPKTGKMQLAPDSPNICFNDQHYTQSNITDCQAVFPLP